MNGPEDPNPNYACFEEIVDLSEFELSDYLLLENDFEEDLSAKTMASSEENLAGSSSNGFAHHKASERRNSNMQVNYWFTLFLCDCYVGPPFFLEEERLLQN